MKKMTFLACAAMLTSLALTGCKGESNDPTQEVPSVTTDITVSLPANAVGGGPAKMPSKTVQVDPSTDFQGITNITLVPFARKGAIVAGDARQGSNITLGDIAASGDLATVSKAKRYTNVKVPMNTASFLFYGESKAKDATGDDLNFKKGVLNPDRDANKPSGFKFELSPILANKTTVTENTKCTGLLDYLNSLLTQVDDATPTPKAWKDYSTAAGDNATFVLLRDTFQTLTTLTSFGVQRMMNDLYETLNLLPDGTLKTNLMNAIKSSTYVEFDGAATPKITLKEAYRDFPYSLNVPEGAVALSYSAGQFVLADPQSYSTTFSVPLLTDYVYPSSLWYYANTQIKTSPNSKQTELESSTNTWDEVLAAYELNDSHVSGTTRSIALKGKINYGVARLDVQVKAAATLTDNTKPTAVTVTTNASGYEVSAILVGNQRNVGFDFTPENYPGYPGTSKEYIIYDKVMSADHIYTATEFASAGKNSTLVLASEVGANKDVYVAVELINNSGVDFRGANGIIPAGGKFYLVGQLLSDKANVQEGTETVNPAKRVFYPDYTTTAKLTITSLEKAYNTIPDLRTPALELGLSVDLTWENGKVYEVNL